MDELVRRGTGPGAGGGTPAAAETQTTVTDTGHSTALGTCGTLELARRPTLRCCAGPDADRRTLNSACGPRGGDWTQCLNSPYPRPARRRSRARPHPRRQAAHGELQAQRGLTWAEMRGGLRLTAFLAGRLTTAPCGGERTSSSHKLPLQSASRRTSPGRCQGRILVIRPPPSIKSRPCTNCADSYALLAGCFTGGGTA